MISKATIIGNESGLHARPASKLTKLASGYESDITIRYEDKVVDVKSIINILSTALPGQSEVVLMADGSDEEDAIFSIANLLETELGE